MAEARRRSTRAGHEGRRLALGAESVPRFSPVISALWRAYRALRLLYWRLVGPTTLGSRCFVLRGHELLLVRHSYEPWWYLPGGGLKRGESFMEAVQREVREETGLRIVSPRLFGVYHNRLEGKNDHVALFVAHCVLTDGPAVASREIEAAAFFPLDRLPDGVSPATRRRIQEYQGETLAETW